MMTERMIKRLIYRWFVHGEKDTANWRPERWPEPWGLIALYADSLLTPYLDDDPLTGEDALWHAIANTSKTPLDQNAHRRLWDDIEAAAEPLHFPTLAEIGDNLPPVSWLWPLWIPRGMLSLLGAYPGTGKSYLALDLARTAIHGGAWPDGSPVARTGPVIYVEAESIPQVTNSRAIALGVDRRQLYLVMAEEGRLLDLTKPYWQDHLLNLVDTVRPSLIIVDSLTSVSSVGQNSVEETNELLMYLVGLARMGDCGLTAIHHLRKPGNGQLALPGVTIHDFRGSSHIVAMARTIFGLSVLQTSGKGFTLNGPRRLDMCKSNLGAYGDPLGITLIEAGDSARFEYGPAPSWDSADSSADTAEAWLLRYLQDNGPTKPADVVAAGIEAGYGERTIYRARKALGDVVQNSHGRQNARNRWMLPADTLADDEETDD